MAERHSALEGHYQSGRFGEPGETGVAVHEVRDLVLYQVAVWPDSLETMADRVAAMAGADAAPGPGRATTGRSGALLRIEPLKWWLYGATAENTEPGDGAILDLSHSRTHLRIAGPRARECLNRLVPVDLRQASFPADTVAATVMHHVGVTLWHSREGFELFLPRGFAQSLWEVFLETAVQFGVEVD